MPFQIIRNDITKVKADSIAFPLIATGVYGFPKDEALNIALSEIGKFLLIHDMTVILVVFDRTAFELSEDLIGKIDEYIDEHGVGIVREEEYGEHGMNYRFEKERAGDRISAAASQGSPTQKSASGVYRHWYILRARCLFAKIYSER